MRFRVNADIGGHKLAGFGGIESGIVECRGRVFVMGLHCGVGGFGWRMRAFARVYST